MRVCMYKSALARMHAHICTCVHACTQACKHVLRSTDACTQQNKRVRRALFPLLLGVKVLRVDRLLADLVDDHEPHQHSLCIRAVRVRCGAGAGAVQVRCSAVQGAHTSGVLSCPGLIAMPRLYCRAAALFYASTALCQHCFICQHYFSPASLLATYTTSYQHCFCKA